MRQSIQHFECLGVIELGSEASGFAYSHAEVDGR